MSQERERLPRRIVKAVLHNLAGRKGLEVLDSLDDDTRGELISDLSFIVDEELWRTK